MSDDQQTQPTDDADDFEWDDNLPPDQKCPTCNGTGTVNPLTAPRGFIAITTTTCPDCDGTGREEL